MAGDLHAPYEDKKAVDLVLKVGKKLKPDILILTGDIADCFSVSSHSKDPMRGRHFGEEAQYVRNLLDRFERLGAKRKVFVLGNHEDRLRRYLEEKAPELYDFIDIPGVFGLKERGWQVVPYKRDTKIGKLHVTHDVGSAGRYNVFKCLDTYQGNVVTGHTHRFSYVVEGNAKGEHMVSAQFGWLGDADAVDYMASVNVKRNWTLGFGVGYLDTDTNNVHLTPIPIIGYRCVVEGTLFK